VILFISFFLMSPCPCYGLFDHISVENRIWSNGLELRSVDSNSSRLCPVDSGSLW
jgi:hypothetical protein